MSGHYLDGDTIAQCHQALREGRTLDELAARLHFEPDRLARLLGLQSQPASVTQPDDYLWAADRLDGVL